MLNDPNTESPANLDASLQFRDDNQAYNKKVRMLAAKSLEDMWSYEKHIWLCERSGWQMKRLDGHIACK